MSQALIPANWSDFPTAFQRRLGQSVGRQRLMTENGHMLLLLHRPPKAHEERRTGHVFWRRPDGTWLANIFVGEAKPLFQHVDAYRKRVEFFEEQEAKADNSADYFAVLEGVSPLYRAIKHLHEVLQQAREAAPMDRELIELRDQAYGLERSAELLYTESKHALDFMAARQAEVMAASSHNMALASHRLNVLVAFFFPISILTTLVGISYHDVVEGTYSLSMFTGVLLLGILLGGGITWLMTRASKP